MRTLEELRKAEVAYWKDKGGYFEVDEGCWIQNKFSRAKVRAFKRMYGQAYLGNINFYDDTPPNFHRYEKGMVYNFEYRIVVPYPDPYLAMLIDQRNAIPYTGTAQDLKLIDPIFDRLYEIGGMVLSWV